LGRREAIPLVLKRLEDPHSGVRQAAAAALARLQAVEAAPALAEAARRAKTPASAASGLRLSDPDPEELLVILNAMRSLQGETKPAAFTSRPDALTRRWPEYDREVFQRQLDLAKALKLIAVLNVNGLPAAAVLRDAQGKEALYKTGEWLPGGFRLGKLETEVRQDGRLIVAASALLARGETQIRLFQNGPPEVKIGPNDRKELGIKNP
jgi:hypothetical protein